MFVEKFRDFRQSQCTDPVTLTNKKTNSWLLRVALTDDKIKLGLGKVIKSTPRHNARMWKLIVNTSREYGIFAWKDNGIS